MAPPLDKSESANSKPDSTPGPPKEKRQPKPTPTDDEPFGFMDAILELKKFFADYPTLLELGKQLRNAHGHEKIIAPPTPTRFGHNSASIIDFALTRNLLWHSQVESIAELSSDHNPILISFDTNSRFGFPKRIISTDWELFRELLSPAKYSFKPITARTGEDVETQVANLTNTILRFPTQTSKCADASSIRSARIQRPPASTANTTGLLRQPSPRIHT
ncbi:hypothetical protein TNCV_65181 [Trichonephila clavipes]|nr:hypothetical protein TNCV_65181 [Trichonephila clavipes]